MRDKRLVMVLCVILAVICIMIAIWLANVAPHREFKLGTGNRENVEKERIDVKRIKDLAVSGAWGVEMRETDKKQFKIEMIVDEELLKKGDQKNIKVSLKKGKLSVDTTAFDEKMKKFASKNNPDKIIMVLIPRSAELRSIAVDTVSGKLELDNVTCEYLRANINCGNFEMKRTKIDEIDADINSGNIIGSVTVGNVDMKSNSGNIDLRFENLPYQMELTANAGDLTVVMPADKVKIPLSFGYMQMAGEREFTGLPKLMKMLEIEDNQKAKKSLKHLLTVNAGNLYVSAE